MKNNILPEILYQFQRYRFLIKYKDFRSKEKEFQIKQAYNQIIIEEFLERNQIFLQFDEKIYFDNVLKSLQIISIQSTRNISQILKNEQQNLLIQQLGNSQ